jgi:hypothetical protein
VDFAREAVFPGFFLCELIASAQLAPDFYGKSGRFDGNIQKIIYLAVPCAGEPATDQKQQGVPGHPQEPFFKLSIGIIT